MRRASGPDSILHLLVEPAAAEPAAGHLGPDGLLGSSLGAVDEVFDHLAGAVGGAGALVFFRFEVLEGVRQATWYLCLGSRAAVTWAFFDDF